MKARLLYFDGAFELLLCTGEIHLVSLSKAREFLLDYNNPNFYSYQGTWDYEGVTMESYHGDTVAYVNDQDILCVCNPALFAQIMNSLLTELITVEQYALNQDKSPARIRRMCSEGRILGAVQIGRNWLIPESASYPPDGRYK